MYRLLALGLILVSSFGFAQKAAEHSTAPAAGLNVLTRENDNQRTGQNLQETILTPANVNSTSFGKIFSYPVDGQIYAQPLYLQNVSTTSGVHNLVYVATENDTLYAFDADSAKTNPAPVWKTSFLTPPSVLPVPCAVGAGICQLFPVVGITSTPVINLATNTIYVTVRTQETTNNVTTYVVKLHALNIANGSERVGSPVTICSGSGNNGCSFGTLGSFPPQHQQPRPGMLLVSDSRFGQGVLYLGFAGNAGWVLAYDAASLTFLAGFYTYDGKAHSVPGLPGTGHSGVWGGGSGIAADTAGNVYAVTGDGFFDGGVNWGDSLVKLSLTGTTGAYSLVVADSFTPTDYTCRWQQSYDLGSAGPLILPSQGGTTPNLIFQAGKISSLCDPVGQYYVVNRDNMGHVGGQVSFTSAAGSTEGSPGYWNSGTTQYIYNTANGDSIRAFTVSAAGVSATDVMHTNFVFANGTSAVVSSNGTSNGIVWGLDFTGSADLFPGRKPLVLHAFDATNLSSELYNSMQAASGRDRAGPFTKYQVPTVINGKVYVGTATELDVYGLCPCPQ